MSNTLKELGYQRSARSAIGERFGRLVVIRHIPKPPHVKFKGLWAWCRCDCGIEKAIAMSPLRSGLQVSCGCLRTEKAVENMKARGFQLVIKAQKPPGYSGMTNLMGNYRRVCARSRGLLWGLSREEFEAIVTAPCTYCGAPPTQTYRNRSGSKKTQERSQIFYNGIDRRDNTQGYIFGNCVSCCWQCNFSKKNLTIEEWDAWIRAIRTSNYVA